MVIQHDIHVKVSTWVVLRTYYTFTGQQLGPVYLCHITVDDTNLQRSAIILRGLGGYALEFGHNKLKLLFHD